MEKIFNVFNIKEVAKNSSYNREYLVNKALNGEYNLLIDQARYPLENLPLIFVNYNLNPEYQRKRVWDIKRKSKLIESCLVNVPIPPVFLYETDYNKYEVMDGLQRISTIISFFKNEFKLEGLELWSEINGCKFSDLPEELRNLIHRRYLSAIIILKESSKGKERELELKQFVFERLNTGGMELSPHEIRNALHPSNFNNMVNELADNKIFKLMIKNTDDELIRMEDREMILRFFAFKSAIKCDYKRGIKVTLDNYQIAAQKFNEEQVEDAKKYFMNVIENVHSIYGDKAFMKSNKGKFEKMIYDTVMLSVSKLLDEGYDLEVLRRRGTVNQTNKNSLIKKNKDQFNGKYTALVNVKARIDIFYNFLSEELSK
ncbi:DUF262 domain-containing protein [Rubeoparvulum massiliense]|uniref:DUF262 domain-containing protein n=1 Tax=Rubeoparvulum massiliense TaxID=1631346 RepID=UPI00065E2579|nr:DUF262 domain-containing protein [Rubeoparvulum massiliense]